MNHNLANLDFGNYVIGLMMCMYVFTFLNHINSSFNDILRRCSEEVFLVIAASVPGAPSPLWSQTSTLSQRVRTTFPRHQVRQVNFAALWETYHRPTALLTNHHINT